MNQNFRKLIRPIVNVKIQPPVVTVQAPVVNASGHSITDRITSYSLGGIGLIIAFASLCTSKASLKTSNASYELAKHDTTQIGILGRLTILLQKEDSDLNAQKAGLHELRNIDKSALEQLLLLSKDIARLSEGDKKSWAVIKDRIDQIDLETDLFNPNFDKTDRHAAQQKSNEIANKIQEVLDLLKDIHYNRVVISNKALLKKIDRFYDFNRNLLIVITEDQASQGRVLQSFKNGLKNFTSYGILENSPKLDSLYFIDMGHALLSP